MNSTKTQLESYEKTYGKYYIKTKVTRYFFSSIVTIRTKHTINMLINITYIYVYLYNINLNTTNYSHCFLVHDYYSLSRQQPSKIKKDLMENGPLQVSMHMYEDFRVYTKGVINANI